MSPFYFAQPLAFRAFTYNVLRRAAVAILLFFAWREAAAASSLSKTCVIPDSHKASLDVDPTTDVYVARRYEQTISQMLKHQSYRQLDCLADRVRAGKERLSGGQWTISLVYGGLEEPNVHPVNSTESEWTAHLQRLRQWVANRPTSVTARVALASAMIRYGWFARGSGMADTVSGNGWKVFEERVAAAKRILDQARALPVKCPGWYVAMEDVALAQGWNDADRRALFDEASKFEPAYYLFYYSYATSILPKWGGEEGATARFLQEQADRVGNESGSALYFEVASKLLCGCNGPDQKLALSWERVEKGFDALTKNFGPSMENLNLYARDAVKMRNSPAAAKLFVRIGDHWHDEIWRSRASFESYRHWADENSPTVAPYSRVYADENNPYLDTARELIGLWKERIATAMPECLRGDANRKKFELHISVDRDGRLTQNYITEQTNVATCVQKKMSDAPLPEWSGVRRLEKPVEFRFEVDPNDFVGLVAQVAPQN